MKRFILMLVDNFSITEIDRCLRILFSDLSEHAHFTFSLDTFVVK